MLVVGEFSFNFVEKGVRLVFCAIDLRVILLTLRTMAVGIPTLSVCGRRLSIPLKCKDVIVVFRARGV